MGIIYTCSQGHRPHIYYMTLTGATGSQDALLTTPDLEQAGVEEKEIGGKKSPLKGNADFMKSSHKRLSVQLLIITLYTAC